MAETFGFNQAYDIGVPVAAPSFPLPESDTEIGAASIGQGRVSVTPAAHGHGRRRGLRRDVAPAVPLPASRPTEGSHALPAAAAAALPEFLREVVRSGTGTGAAILGRDVGGKTGTAEFGEEDPPETHAWFAGFIGDLAFAVVVEGGGIGGEVAAPIVHEFLVNLPAPPVGPGAAAGEAGG